MDTIAKAVINKTYDELKCGGRTLAPSFEFESTLAQAGYVIVPKEPTENMLNAARDWSVEKYGCGVGNDGAIGCYRSMIAAST